MQAAVDNVRTQFVRSHLAAPLNHCLCRHPDQLGQTASAIQLD
jgi:hypothetical protein